MVCFQPPESVKLVYPCILYELDDDSVRHADNRRYIGWDRYLVTLIDKNPDSRIDHCLRELPYCSFQRCYRKDNMNHFVYTIYSK